MNDLKVLIVNRNSIYGPTAESITVRNIFAVWPKEHLMEIYFSEGSAAAADGGIRSYFVETKWNFLRRSAQSPVFKRLNQIMKAGELPSVSENGGNRQESKSPASVIGWLRQWLALFISDSPYRIPPDVEKEIIEFAPRVIYTSASGISIMRVVTALSQSLEIPVLPHFMDNWQESLEWSNNPLLANYKRNVDNWVKRIYQRSPAALAISDRMAEVYAQKWGIPHYPLMNVAEASSYHCDDKPMDDTVHFAYTGGLHLARWRALNEIGMEIDRIAPALGISCIFDFYCPRKDTEQFQAGLTAKCIRIHEPVPHEQIKRIYEETDILVHAETEQLLDDLYARYSLTTKLPEYLVSNRPILYYGPEQLYLTQYLLCHDVAFVAATKEYLGAAVQSVLTQNEERKLKANFAASLAAASYCNGHAKQVLLLAMGLEPHSETRR